MDALNNILSVAGGEKELQIDIKDETKYQLGAIIFLAIALGAFVGVVVATKITQ